MELSYADKQQAVGAREWEALEVMKTDLCQWLARVLEIGINPSNFMATLDSGVNVCKLACLIQQAVKHAKERGALFDFEVPIEPPSYKVAGGGDFYARDNASNFISWCRHIGVKEAVIFESEGLVLRKDEKRVILCLLDVARFAEEVGIDPPQLVRMEREIEMLESAGKKVLPVSSIPDKPSNDSHTQLKSQLEASKSLLPVSSHMSTNFFFSFK